MREGILLCTKKVHFAFNGKTFTQVDGVAMGSSLAPILAGIFIVELERNLIPILKDHLSFWRQYVGDTFVSSKMNRLNMYCQHSIVFIVPLNLLMKQKVVASYPS